MNKTCGACKISKPVSAFNAKGEGKWQYFCRVCQKAYHASHYKAHKKDYIQKAKAHRASIKSAVAELKRGRPCADCGVVYPPYVMDFDHLDGDKKVNNLAVMAHNSMSMESILSEIEKCELVCSNCHRERSHQRSLRKKKR